MSAGSSQFNSLVYTNNLVTWNFQRPATTIAYAANDVISNSTDPSSLMIEFPNVFPVQNIFGYITGAQIITTDYSCTARIRAYLWSQQPGQSNIDNDPFSSQYETLAITGYLGYLDFPAMAKYGATVFDSCAFTQITDCRLFIKSENSLKLWWTFQTLDAFTPISTSDWTLKLMCDLTV